MSPTVQGGCHLIAILAEGLPNRVRELAVRSSILGDLRAAIADRRHPGLVPAVRRSHTPRQRFAKLTVIDVVGQILFALEVLKSRSRFLENEPPLARLTQNVPGVVLPPLQLVGIDARRIIEHHPRLIVRLPEASAVPLFERIDVRDSIPPGVATSHSARPAVAKARRSVSRAKLAAKLTATAGSKKRRKE